MNYHRLAYFYHFQRSNTDNNEKNIGRKNCNMHATERVQKALIPRRTRR